MPQASDQSSVRELQSFPPLVFGGVADVGDSFGHSLTFVAQQDEFYQLIAAMNPCPAATTAIRMALLTRRTRSPATG